MPSTPKADSSVSERAGDAWAMAQQLGLAVCHMLVERLADGLSLLGPALHGDITRALVSGQETSQTMMLWAGDDPQELNAPARVAMEVLTSHFNIDNDSLRCARVCMCWSSSASGV